MANCGHNGATGWKHFTPYEHQGLDLCSRCYVIVTKEHDYALRKREDEIATERAARESAEQQRQADLIDHGLREAALMERCESAEQLAVFAVHHSAIHYRGRLLYVISPDDPDAVQRSYECDSTDAGILAALRRAMEGEK